MLSLLLCLALRATLPGLSRRTVLVIVTTAIPLLAILIVGLVGIAVNGNFSLSFVMAMRWQGWMFLLAATVAGFLIARRLASVPSRKVDPTVFE